MKKGKNLTLHHIGIVVPDLSESTEFFKKLLGINEVSFETLEDRGLKIALLRLPNVILELISPARDSTSVDKFLKDRGGGLHHIALLTEDFDTFLSIIKDSGIRIVDGPHKGVFSDRVIFLHPKDTKKVLIEIMEKKK